MAVRLGLWDGVSRRRLAYVATLAGVVSLPGTALGQVIDHYFNPAGAGPGGRPGEESRAETQSRYQSSGVRAGSFVVRPDVQEMLGYDSNAAGTRGGRDSAFVSTGAGVSATSDWSRNSLFLTASVEDRRYLELSKQNYINWTASTGGTFDIGRDKVGATYSHLNLTQTPGSIDAVTLAQPVPFRVDIGQLSYTAATFSHVTLVPELSVTRYDFDDYGTGTTKVSQAFRNRTAVLGAVTARYESKPQTDYLLVVRGSDILYLTGTPTAPKRDSTGGAILAGVDYPATGSNFRFRVLAGVQVRQYKNSAYQNLTSPIIEASVTWSPTRLTSITLLARRDIEDAADESIAGYNYTSVRASVDHELRRNILLNGFVEIQQAEFQKAKLSISTPGLPEAGTSQTFLNAGASANWLLNRQLRAGVAYIINDRRSSNGNAGTYVSSTGLLTLGLRL